MYNLFKTVSNIMGGKGPSEAMVVIYAWTYRLLYTVNTAD